MYTFLKALHVISMFGAVTLLMGDAYFLGLAFWRRDVQALAAMHRLAPGLGLTTAGLILFLVGIAFGLILAATGQLNFLSGWLIAAYIIVAALIATNASPFVQRLRPLVRQAAEVADGKRSEQEVVIGMDSVRSGLLLAIAINTVLFILVIADMVLKPL